MMHVTILGKRFNLRFCRIATGECDPPYMSGKEIRINKRYRNLDRLETIVHECIHACAWHVDEEYVEAGARDLARVLWRLGYRMEGDDGTQRSGTTRG